MWQDISQSWQALRCHFYCVYKVFPLAVNNILKRYGVVSDMFKEYFHIEKKHFVSTQIDKHYG